MQPRTTGFLPPAKATQSLFEHQAKHLIVWLGVGGLLLVEAQRVSLQTAVHWNLDANTWLIISWAFAALHQGWIAVFWRLELLGQRVTKKLGRSGFVIFRIGFVLFASVRLLAIIPISFATPDTIAIPPWLSSGLIVVTTPLILWGLYSVAAYFGFTRAFGADHFDPAYRTLGVERRGIFKYVSNSMYTVVLLALYHPGLLVHSYMGLVVAAGHHALVWTHYFCTERPDMAAIYDCADATVTD